MTLSFNSSFFCLLIVNSVSNSLSSHQNLIQDEKSVSDALYLIDISWSDSNSDSNLRSSHCTHTAVTLLHNIITHFCCCIIFSFINNCVSASASWAEVMFLRDNILTDKSVSTLLSAYTSDNLTTKVLWVLMFVVYCFMIMMKRLCYWMNCLFKNKVIKAVKLS